MPDDTPRRKVGFYDNQTVSDLWVDSNTDGSGDPVPKPAPSELAEHSTSEEHSLRPGYPVLDDRARGKVRFYDNQTVSDLLVDSNTDGGGDPVPRSAPSELAEHSTSVQHSLRLLQPELSEHPAGTTSVVIPPDSEIVAKFSVSGIRPHSCTLVEPARCLTEEYGVVVGHTLVDASSGSGRVFIVNPNAEVVVLPGLTLNGKLVPVAAISVAMEETGLPNDGPAALPEYLEEIVGGSHPSLGDAGRQRLRDLIFRYRHVFPAPGEPVTGRTTTVQHDIITTDARPVRCSPRRLAPAGLRKEQTCVQEMLDGDKLSLVIALGHPRCFGNQERRNNVVLCRLP